MCTSDVLPQCRWATKGFLTVAHEANDRLSRVAPFAVRLQCVDRLEDCRTSAALVAASLRSETMCVRNMVTQLSLSFVGFAAAVLCALEW